MAVYFGGSGGTGGIAGTAGTGGIWPSDCCCWRGRCSLRFSTSFACASRSACRLDIACSCCEMKSEVPGLSGRRGQHKTRAEQRRRKQARATRIREQELRTRCDRISGSDTHRIRRIRRMVSPLETSFSFSCCFSFLRFLIVPRLRCWYTLFARFLIEGAARRLCCIIRTHSSMSASLESRTGSAEGHGRRAETCQTHVCQS